MKKRKKVKLSIIPKNDVYRKSIDEDQFQNLLLEIKSGLLTPFDQITQRSRNKLTGPTIIGSARYKPCSTKITYPVCVVSTESRICYTFYLSKEQYRQFLEVKASIQRPIKPVKPTSPNTDKPQKSEGGKNEFVFRNIYIRLFSFRSLLCRDRNI